MSMAIFVMLYLSIVFGYILEIIPILELECGHCIFRWSGGF
jgi:hypothetical protein